MIWLVLTLTLRQLLGQRRTLFLAAVAVLPLVAAIIYQASGGEGDAGEFTAQVVLYGLIVTALLPLTAVLLSTAAIGSEIEDGTIVYLLSKPVERWRILAGKLLAAWGATTVIVLASALVGSVVALVGEDDWSILGGFLIALAAGSLAYSSLFVMLSLFTSRALLAGIAYAFIWEGVITNFAPGVQRFSIREYTASIAEAAGDISPWVFEAELGLTYSVILVVVVTAVAAGLAVVRLARFELSGVE
ncbi:MAG: ABC transporter permease subunit [Dehalococcoidia bacterium]|nr:ABC transporter permease subunit [Dehalococcoidia bacterium]MYA53392.1 ABC transporter permease subunit [Dehalococcoidia bacterium]